MNAQELLTAIGELSRDDVLREMSKHSAQERALRVILRAVEKIEEEREWWPRACGEDAVAK